MPYLESTSSRLHPAGRAMVKPSPSVNSSYPAGRSSTRVDGSGMFSPPVGPGGGCSTVPVAVGSAVGDGLAVTVGLSSARSSVPPPFRTIRVATSPTVTPRAAAPPTTSQRRRRRAPGAVAGPGTGAPGWCAGPYYGSAGGRGAGGGGEGPGGGGGGGGAAGHSRAAGVGPDRETL